MEAWAGAGGLLVNPYREIDMETRIFSKKDRGSGAGSEGRRTCGFSDGDGLRSWGEWA